MPPVSSTKVTVPPPDLVPEVSPADARRRVEAFSLVEVVLAIGLVTFAMLVIFSLLPVGLFSLQESNRQIVETEIFNTIGAELSSTPFNQLSNYQQTRFPIYYNLEGSETTNASDSIFFVRCDPPIADSNSELSRVVVSIGYHRDPALTNSTAKPTKRAFLMVNRGL